MESLDYSIERTCDLNTGFVGLNFAQFIELLDTGARLNKPLYQLAFCDTLADISQEKWFDDIGSMRGMKMSPWMRPGSA
jgi:hypothetical protein